ncbi:unnamed protein product [marine sediment metagenome]|uniref:Uncharacterized protein n=1 Tax=marine sediment metagenome TaxID=412755 RepID=X1TML8_9ZZZZ
MRNQTWDEDGVLVRDNELYLDDRVLKVRDINGVVREPTQAETGQFYWKPPRDPLSEIDEIKADYATLKAKVDILKKKKRSPQGTETN